MGAGNLVSAAKPNAAGLPRVNYTPVRSAGTIAFRIFDVIVQVWEVAFVLLLEVRRRHMMNMIPTACPGGGIRRRQGRQVAQE
jgi:hypothetical protein